MTATTSPVSTACPTQTGTLTVQPYTASKEEYQAITDIFAAILTAACLIWGLKRVFLLFRSGPES